jgi:ribonuclease HI
VFTDGGARGNPGPAAVGAVIQGVDNKVQKYSKYIGKATNNQAEYQAGVLGLQKAKSLGAKVIDCFLDSELVVKQLNHQYKVKNKDLGPFFLKIWNLSQSFKEVNFHYIPREQNKEADKLVNLALDSSPFSRRKPR